MRSIRNLSLIILSLILFSACADAQTRKKTSGSKTSSKTGKPAVKPASEKPVQTTPVEYKVLVEGQYSKVETPFLLVARDAQTFALIRTLVDDLPASSTIDFKKTAVVAAFAGERNTGGWSVAIRPISSKTLVDILAPRKGAMTAQVITQPFRVALVPVSELEPLSIELTPTWTSGMKMYRVSKSDFESSGGIAGTVKKFSAEGTIGVLSFGEIVTLSFNLSGVGAEQGRKLSHLASGVVRAGNVELARLDAGTFAQMPHPPVKVFGTANENKLSLIFESHPPIASDGFMLRGKLEAAKSK